MLDIYRRIPTSSTTPAHGNRRCVYGLLLQVEEDGRVETTFILQRLVDPIEVDIRIADRMELLASPFSNRRNVVTSSLIASVCYHPVQVIPQLRPVGGIRAEIETVQRIVDRS